MSIRTLRCSHPASRSPTLGLSACKTSNDEAKWALAWRLPRSCRRSRRPARIRAKRSTSSIAAPATTFPMSRRRPTRATLARMPAGAITNALIAGKMRIPQAVNR